jgi:Sulfocyanin (SoxE) domain
MPIPLSTRFMTLLVAGAAGIAGASCSKSSNESPRVETAAASAAPAQPAGSTDTAAKVEAQQPETVSAAKPARKKPVVEAAAPAPKPAPPAPKPAPPAPKPAATAPDSAAPAPAGPDKWLSYDAATKTVTFELVAGPFTFNGYRDGGGTLVVPPKANMVMNFINKDGTPHSAILISGDGPLPNSATDPAIPRAYTNKVLEGLPQEGSDVMRFPAPDSGTYRIFCGVPGHGSSGMWIWMKIDPAARAPTFGPTKA